MSKRIVIALLVIASILGLSYVLIPDHREVALMRWQDANYTQAFADYEKLKDGGDYSPNVVIPLVSLYQHYGDIGKSIRLMEEFTRRNPRNIEAYRQLVELYDSAQRPNDYCHALEELQKLSPSAENLRKLADTYHFLSRYQEHQSALERLLKSPGYEQQERDVVALAHYEALQKKFKEAYLLLEHYTYNADEPATMESIRLAVHLAFAAAQKEKAFKLAEFYNKQVRNPAKAGELAALFASYQDNASALALLTPFEDEIANTPFLFAQFMSLQVSNGQEDVAYPKLIQHLHDKTLPPQATEVLLHLALVRKDYPMLEEALQAADLSDLSEATLWDYAEASFITKEPRIAQALLSRKEAERFSPLFNAVLKTAISDTLEHMRTVQTEAFADKALAPAQKRLLSILFVHHGLYGPAYTMLQGSPVKDTVKSLGAWQVVDLYMRLNRGAELRSLIQSVNPEDAAGLQDVSSLLAAANGDMAAVKALLAQSPAPEPKLLTDMQSLAQAYRQKDASLLLAQNLYQNAATPANRLILAGALVSAGKFTTALPHLRELKATHKEAHELYTQALIGMVKNGSGLPSEAFEKALAELISTGGRTPKERQELAYLLVEIGKKDTARDMFMQFAANKPFESDETKEALFLIGDTPDESGLQWIEHQARAASGANQAGWLTYMLGLRQTERVAGFYTEGMQEVAPETIPVLLEALSDARQEKKLESLLAYALERTEAPEQIRHYAKTAEGQNLRAAAIAAWQKLYTLDAADKEANRALGIDAYEHKRYADAAPYLSKYLAEEQGDYLANYDYAEILQRQKKPEAKTYYERALAQTEKAPQKDFGAQSTRASIMQRLGKLKEARELLKELIDTYPHNTALKADYTNLLIQMRDFNEASTILSNTPEEVTQ